MARTRIRGVEEVRSYMGRELGVGEWTTITQDRVNLFAEATGDFQWIHVDAARVAASGFRAPVAHGFLILAMTAVLKGYELELPVRHALNYGMNRVRFPAPVYVGDRVRFRSRLLGVEEPGPGQLQLRLRHTAEIQGRSKPGCVSENLVRYYLDPAAGP